MNNINNSETVVKKDEVSTHTPLQIEEKQQSVSDIRSPSNRKIFYSWLVGYGIPAIFFSVAWRNVEPGVTQTNGIDSIHWSIFLVWFLVFGLWIFGQCARNSEKKDFLKQRGMFFWTALFCLFAIIAYFFVGLFLGTLSGFWTVSMGVVFATSFFIPASSIFFAKASGIFFSLIVVLFLRRKLDTGKDLSFGIFLNKKISPVFLQGLAFGIIFPIVGVIFAYTFFVGPINNELTDAFRQWFLAYYFIFGVLFTFFFLRHFPRKILSEKFFPGTQPTIYRLYSLLILVVLSGVIFLLPLTLFAPLWKESRLSFFHGKVFGLENKQNIKEDLVSQEILSRQPVFFSKDIHVNSLFWVDNDRLVITGSTETESTGSFVANIKTRSIQKIPAELGEWNLCFDGTSLRYFDVFKHVEFTGSDFQNREAFQHDKKLLTEDQIAEYSCGKQGTPAFLPKYNITRLRPQDGFLTYKTQEGKNEGKIAVLVSRDGSILKQTEVSFLVKKDTPSLTAAWYSFKGQYLLSGFGDPDELSMLWWMSPDGKLTKETIPSIPGPWNNHDRNGLRYVPVKDGILARADFSSVDSDWENQSMKTTGLGVYLLSPTGNVEKLVSGYAKGLAFLEPDGVSPDGCHIAFGLTEEFKTAWKNPQFNSAFTVLNVCEE